MKKILTIFILFFGLSLSFSFADNSQEYLEVDKYGDEIVKTANYTFDYTTDILRIYDKSGKKLITAIYKGDFYYPSSFFVNDKYVYYTKGKYIQKGDKNDYISPIVQLNLTTKKSKIIKSTYSNDIGGIKGNKLYYIESIDVPLTLDITPNYDYRRLMVMDLSTFKSRLIRKSVDSVKLGKTKIFFDIARMDQLHPSILYSMDYNYKNIKLVEEGVYVYKPMGGKIYYTNTRSLIDSISGDDIVYVRNEDGTDKKVFAKAVNGTVYRILPTEIRYKESTDLSYKMNLKTKKVVRIK